MPPVDLLAAISGSDKLSDVSKKNYLEKLKHLSERCESPLAKMVTSPGTTIPKMKGWFGSKATTLKSYYVAVLAVFRYNPRYACRYKSAHEAWRAAFAETEEMVTARYETNMPTEKQIDGYVEWKDIITKRDSLVTGSRERLLLSMYTYIRPLRADFGKMAIVSKRDDTDNKGNRLELNGRDSRMVVSEYKTAKHYDEIVIDPLPAPLRTEIEASLKVSPRSWLFCADQKSDRPFVSNRTFAKWARLVLRRLFDRPVTLQLLRHSYINSLDFNTLSVAEKKEIAAEMGHDVATQDRYRLFFKQKG